MGRIKEFLHYCQVDQDLGTVEEVQDLYKEGVAKWEAMDMRLRDAYFDVLPRLEWPP